MFHWSLHGLYPKRSLSSSLCSANMSLSWQRDILAGIKLMFDVGKLTCWAYWIYTGPSGLTGSTQILWRGLQEDLAETEKQKWNHKSERHRCYAAATKDGKDCKFSRMYKGQGMTLPPGPPKGISPAGCLFLAVPDKICALISKIKL